MRYVIIVALFTGFLIWDGMSNGGRSMDTLLRMIRSMLTAVGL